MVQSILDTDLYKFSTSNAYFQLYPLAEGTFTFNDRSKEVYDESYLATLKAELARMCALSLSEDEFEYVTNHIRYISRNYWEWLRGFRFEADKIDCRLDAEGHLKIDVTDLMYKVTLYEVPILATVAELRNRRFKLDEAEAMQRLDAKIELANKEELVFSEFGTRRRFSSDLHEAVVRRLKEACPKYCAGTSNVLYAKMFNLVPVGTFPHEWMMFHSGVFGYKRANYLGLEDWISVYDGALGTALIDTFTTASFLRTLTLKQAKLLDGFRQDSGDEIEIGEMIIARLEEFGIDPRTKLLVFSNALDFPKYSRIAAYFKGRIKVSAGIGTNLTCDPGIPGYKAANIVMKLSRCRMSAKDPWEKVIKISDDTGKHMGEDVEFGIASHELHLA
ncbi:MAG: nicotinate phosphoribosyltransferase [Bacteroidales bacterium]|nr:nicotinate phosphoribosyltransferase [Bacteroidales bacterium]MBO4566182.1 nicotinate phosphoribosyltransferase [Bacteroidales bacterium]